MSAVLIDRNRRTAILVRQTASALYLVEMRQGELTLARMDEDSFAARGFAPADYALERAVERFLRHAGGVSEAARRALEQLRSAAAG